MPAIPFDTLKFVEKLESGGFTAAQARAAAEAFADATGQELASKADILRLETKLDAGIARLETKLDTSLQLLEQRMVIKLGALIVAATGVILTALRLFAH